MSSQEQVFYELLARLRDYHNGIATELDKFIQTKSQAVQKDYDLEKIKWEDRTGDKGPYQATDDVNNLEYKALREDLASHDGKLQHNGFFLWVFQNGTTIGRKKVR